LSAENIIVHSSNIGIAQLAQKLSGSEFYSGLKAFGFSKKSTKDLIYEKKGSIPSALKLENKIYKATGAYGYGMRVNLMQLIRAYSAFNNNGRIVNPKIVDSFVDEFGREIPIENEEDIQVIKSSTAQKIKKILIKTVLEGTGKKTISQGLEVGGKTGTAHKVEKGKYINKYNTSFLGFVNDTTHKYTIGVVVIEPQSSQFASQTAVPVCKNAIDILTEDGYLNPNIIK
jgi:cell division protein FtsI (penicillin-binding protein 3)